MNWMESKEWGCHQSLRPVEAEDAEADSCEEKGCTAVKEDVGPVETRGLAVANVIVEPANGEINI